LALHQQGCYSRTVHSQARAGEPQSKESPVTSSSECRAGRASGSRKAREWNREL